MEGRDRDARESGGDGFLLRKVGVEKPPDLGGLERGGAIISGAGFDGVEPLRCFRKAAGGYDAQAWALLGRGLQKIGERISFRGTKH